MVISDNDVAVVVKSISIDPHLSMDEKKQLITTIKEQRQENFVQGLLGGAAGYAVAKFLKLSNTAQIALTLAGFGIGKYLLDNDRKRDKFISYDDNLKHFKLNA